jgi:hypothetical protein
MLFSLYLLYKVPFLTVVEIQARPNALEQACCN